MTLKTETFSEFNSEINAIWEDLEKKCHHYVFQCHDWIYHWYKTIGVDVELIKPCIVVVKNDNDYLALFPLGIVKSYGARILKFMGGNQNDYNLPLISFKLKEEKTIRAIWDIVNKNFPIHDIQLFEKIPEKINNFENIILKTWNCDSGFSAYSSTLPLSFDIFQKKISKKIINDSKRQVRRLSELGELEFKIAKNQEEYDSFFNEMIKQKRRRYQETGAIDNLSNPKVQSFYNHSREKMNRNVKIQISAVLVNDNILATHWGIIYLDRFYFLLPTYAGGDWKKFSTGRLLQEWLIEWAINSKLKFFDFTIGNEVYKKSYCDEEIKIFKREKLMTPYGLPFFIYSKLISYTKNNSYLRKLLMKINSKL